MAYLFMTRQFDVVIWKSIKLSSSLDNIITDTLTCIAILIDLRTINSLEWHTLRVCHSKLK